MSTANILIGSGGRRNYLVRWFREAMQKLGVDGEVCVVDANPFAPALADADRSGTVAPLTDPSYEKEIVDLCREWQISLAISLNDYELAAWSGPLSDVLRQEGVRVVAAPPKSQRMVEDKLQYPAAFGEVGLRSPDVVSGAAAFLDGVLPEDRGAGYIVKHRFGSGSGGLTMSSADRVRDDVKFQAALARDRHGRRAASPEAGLDLLVVQTRVEGEEYGLDVVNDFESEFRGALARRKLRMRSGETDQATVVDALPFRGLAAKLSQVLGHQGLVDADVIVDGAEKWLIDVNPRFGGGYPFSHVAGADVPACYLSWHLGLGLDDAWLHPRQGVTSAKAESLHIVSSTAGTYE